MGTNRCGKNVIKELEGLLSRRQRTPIEEPGHVRAAVVVPLFNKAGICHILFTRRTQEVKHHKGQISFPGGAFDEEDGDLRQTALRETFEEIGLRKRDIRIMGILDDIVTSTGFIVTPFVGYFNYPYPFRLSKREIEELIEVPLSSLLNPECFGEREIAEGDRKRMVDSYQYEKHSIWGATAKILKQFLELISSFPHPSEV